MRADRQAFCRVARPGVGLMVCLAWLIAAPGAWVPGTAVAQQEPAVPVPPAGDEAAKPAPAAPAEEPPEQGPGGSGKITGPRDLLRRFGIDDSRFGRFLDGRLLHGDEVETLLRILLRLDDVPSEDIDRWARRKLDLSELATDPEPQRGQIFPVEGRVVRIDVRRPEPEIIRLYDMPEYYRCEFVLAGSEQPAVVYTRTVPAAWKAGGTMDQRAGAMGFFLKLGCEDTKRPIPVFAARRVAWFPAGPLGDLGFDAGLLDDVQDKKELLQEEREAFYQMLAAVRRAKPGQLRREANEQIAKIKAEGTPEQIKARIDADTDSTAAIPLFTKPAEWRGRLAVVTGTARKVVLIRVDDPDIRNRFGIDHYYEVSIVTLDSQGHPLVFCVPDLPEGMPAGNRLNYAETVRVAGFFLKTWVYRVPPPPDTPKTEAETKVWKWQAPLLIAHELRWYPREEPPSTTLAGAIAGGLFLVALLGIWLAIWRYNRGDKAFHEKTIARNFAIDSGISLDQLGLDADGKPDFSALEGSDRSASDDNEPPAGGAGVRPV